MSFVLQQLLLITALLLLLLLLLLLMKNVISIKGLLEECDKEETVAVTGAATFSCLK